MLFGIGLKKRYNSLHQITVHLYSFDFFIKLSEHLNLKIRFLDFFNFSFIYLIHLGNLIKIIIRQYIESVLHLFDLLIRIFI